MKLRSPKGTPAAERIRRLTEQRADGCWIWQGRVTSCGYGQMTVGGQKKQYAHRAAYEAFIQPIPAGMVIDHLCRTKACVNPAHLEVVTYGENTRRWHAGRKSA